MNARQPSESELKKSELENLLDTDPGRNIILHDLSTTAYDSLRFVNKSMFNFFKRHPVQSLVYYLVHKPDEKSVWDILNAYPHLLNFQFKKVVFQKYTATNMTPLQLAHSAGDIEMRDNVFEPLFIQHYGDEQKGIEEMQKQISELKNIHKPFDFGLIMQAISNEPFNLGKDETNRWILSPAMLAAIDVFIEEYDENQPKIFDKAMLFSWETLGKFAEAYAANAAQWGGNNYYLRCALTEEAVLREVILRAPENDKQRFNQGIYYFQQANPEQFKRWQKNRDDASFDDSLKARSVNFNLRASCSDIIFGRAAMRGGWCGVPTVAVGVAAVTKFLSNKNFKLAELMQPHPVHQSTGRVKF